ncbi:MAG: hypothetical protein H8E26_12350 [FCB group bacterium]|nr:hypothetical protein [FCB group bacterium]MBL7028301.1 hypothetical protein [Candidatus Neomarinimicrobiota bacterium]MBL7121620.1 hypothetical protein [Candidatus Neomarinimicrobiota bacterium]
MWIKILLLVVFGGTVFLTGYWLHRTGSTYGTFVLAIHKVVALIAMILIGALLVAVNRDIGLSMTDIYLSAATLILLIITMASGGVISAVDKSPQWVLLLHRIIPYFASIAAGYCAYISFTKV